MTSNQNYLDINKTLWNEKTAYHLSSDFYDVAGFKAGKSTINAIELPLLPNLAGKKLLHLQCHFGQDTISLARMGAIVTGVDLSDKAIEAANKISSELDIEAKFINADVYALPAVLDEQFDIVFSSYGTIGWLPDMKRWAKVVSHFVKKGGVFVFAEFHPVVWMFDNDMKYIQYPYFNKEEIVENEIGTYADRDAPIRATSITWNHSLSEVMQALIDEGFDIEHFQEYDYSPYNVLGDMVEIAPGQFHVKGMKGKLPLVYSLRAIKR